MPTEDHFRKADEYLTHVQAAISTVKDGFIQSRYLGFVIVSSVTVYEISIKEIISSFANRKHKVFGQFVDGKFERLNARIQIQDLLGDFVENFGDVYAKRFRKLLDDQEKAILLKQRASMKGAYKNLIKWRHDFVHTGAAPPTTNFGEVHQSYELGKDVVRCLERALIR